MKKAKEVHYIYIFRHGQTYYNRDGIFTGWKDIKLTPLGIKQARKIGKKLKNKQINLAFQTKLSRSKDTLKKVLKYHLECKKIITDNRVIKTNGKEEYNKIHRNFYAKPLQGESFSDVEKRVKPFIKDLIKMIKKQKVNVAISAHGNSIRLFRKIMENLSIEKTKKLIIPYDDYYVYKIKV